MKQAVHCCGNCVFSRVNGEDVISCHRYPPTITEARGSTVTSYFPLLSISGWCGEHKRKSKDGKFI